MIACTRIVGPTIDHSTSRNHLTEAAHNVARSVEELLVDANGACKYSTSGNGEQQYGDLHAAAQQVCLKFLFMQKVFIFELFLNKENKFRSVMLLMILLTMFVLILQVSYIIVRLNKIIVMNRSYNLQIV